jgi:molecular chaperone DnaK
VQAAIIAGEPLDAILVDVTPHSLGIQVAEWEFGTLVPDRYSVIIQRNTTIPTSRSEVYAAVYPDQSTIAIKVYQGEAPIASQNTLLGEFMFENLRPETAGQPPRIVVQFDFDVNGLLHVSAVDRGSGNQARMSVKAAREQLSASEIASTRSSLEALESGTPLLIDGELADSGEFDSDEDDEEFGEGDTLMLGDVEVDSLLDRARRVLMKVSGVAAADLQTAIGELEQAVKLGGQEAVEERAEKLIDILYEIEDEDE